MKKIKYLEIEAESEMAYEILPDDICPQQKAKALNSSILTILNYVP